jgi:hypothetical protein
VPEKWGSAGSIQQIPDSVMEFSSWQCGDKYLYAAGSRGLFHCLYRTAVTRRWKHERFIPHPMATGSETIPVYPNKVGKIPAAYCPFMM